jgi:hypothetical protein
MGTTIELNSLEFANTLASRRELHMPPIGALLRNSDHRKSITDQTKMPSQMFGWPPMGQHFGPPAIGFSRFQKFPEISDFMIFRIARNWIFEISEISGNFRFHDFPDFRNFRKFTIFTISTLAEQFGCPPNSSGADQWAQLLS